MSLQQTEWEVEIGDLDQLLKDQKSGQVPFQRHLQVGKQRCRECTPLGQGLAHKRSCLHAMLHSQGQSTHLYIANQTPTSNQPSRQVEHLAPTSVCTEILFDKTPTDLRHSWHHES